MNETTEISILELHERLMKKFMDRIAECVAGLQVAVEGTKTDDPGTKVAVPETPGQQMASPDKLNVIRHQVAADKDLVILNPDKQKELLEILKQGYEEFEGQLYRIISKDDSRAELATQKFKDELLANAKNQLAHKKHTFAD
jgi:hypothetical protein